MPDLFISYAHVDKHWVDRFVPLLEQRVNQYVGRANPDRIWKDNRFSGNATITPEIEAQLAQTRCLISFLSPGYLASEWCNYELDTFSRRVDNDSSRIFYVEIDQISLQQKPELLRQTLGFQFWWQDALSKRSYPLNAGQPDFENRLTDLAKDIAGALGASSNGASQVSHASAGRVPVDSVVAGNQPGDAAANVDSFLRQKRDSLQSRRALLHELLTRQQDELTFADDAKRQMRLERDIKETQQQLGLVEAEILKWQS